MFHWFRLCNFVAAFTIAVTGASKGAADERYDAPAVGFALNGGNGDFSAGIGATSPWFFESSLALQAAAFQSWTMHGVDKESGEESWMPFTSYRLGLVGGSLTANGFMRMYGAGGLLYVLPNKNVSEKKSTAGTYGAFGFEFLSGRNLNYYIELGANGISTHADKLSGKPLYGNGFFTTVGFRYYL